MCTQKTLSQQRVSLMLCNQIKIAHLSENYLKYLKFENALIQVSLITNSIKLFVKKTKISMLVNRF